MIPDPSLRNYTRWYESDSTVNQAFSTYLSLPLKYQRFLGEFLIHFSKNVVSRSHDKNELLSLGTSRVVGLWKSQSKRRDYDQDKIVYKALSAVYLLNNTDRAYLSSRFQAAMACLDRYKKSCMQKKRTEYHHEMSCLVHNTLSWGELAGKQYLNQLNL